MDIWDIVVEYWTFRDGYRAYISLLERGKANKSELVDIDEAVFNGNWDSEPTRDNMLKVYASALKSNDLPNNKLRFELFDFLDTFSPEDRTVAILKYFKDIGYYFIPNYYLSGISLGLLSMNDMRAFVKATIVRTKSNAVEKSEDFIGSLVTIAGLIESGIMTVQDIFDVISVEEEGLSSSNLYLSNSGQLRTILDTVYGEAITGALRNRAKNPSFVAHLLLFITELRTPKAIEIMRSRVLATLSCERLFDDFSRHIGYWGSNYVTPRTILRAEQLIEKSCDRLITDFDPSLLTGEGRLRQQVLLGYRRTDDV